MDCGVILLSSISGCNGQSAQVAIMVLPATRHSPRARGEGWGPIVRLIGLQGALVVDALLLGLFVPRARRLRLLLGHLAKLNHDLGENVLAERPAKLPDRTRNEHLTLDRRLVLRALLTTTAVLARCASMAVRHAKWSPDTRQLATFLLK